MARFTAQAALLATLLVGVPNSAWADKPASNSALKLGGPPTVTAPISGNPVRLIAVPGEEIYALMDDHTVRALSTKETVLEMVEKDPKFTIGTVMCAVAPSNRVACLYEASKTTGSGSSSTTYRKLVLASTEEVSKTAESSSSIAKNRKLPMTTGGHKEIGSGSDKGYEIYGLGIHFEPDGTLTYAYAETLPRGNAMISSTLLVRGDKKKDLKIGSAGFLAKLAEVGSGDRKDPPVQFVEFKDKLWLVHRDGTDIAVHTPGTSAKVVASNTLHDIRPVVTSDGWFYVFYHDARANSANVAMSQDGEEWKTVELDGKESGWQMEAAAKDDTVLAVFYYFRNSFNKGLRAAILQNGKVKQAAFTIVREQSFNTGWLPLLAVGTDGETWLTYLHNVEDQQRVWCKFKDPGELKSHEIGASTGWEEDYKDYYLQTGAGLWYTWWKLADGAPKAGDTGGLSVGKTSYNVGASMLVSANLEARYGSFNVGASYAQSVIDDASKQVGSSSGILSGSIKLDDLMLGHDLKLAMIWGRYRGLATAGANVWGPGGDSAENPGNTQLPIKTNYLDTQVLLLNKWRVKYGLGYTSYEVPASVHAWYSPANSANYNYGGSFLRNVRFTLIDFIIGYSKLDYAAKYENHYNNFFLDGSFAIGVAMMKYDSVTTPIGTKDSATSLNYRGTAQLGWLFFHRWQSAHGMGFYLRPAYTLELTFLGSYSSPDSRDNTKDNDIAARPWMRSIRHGPWFDLGLVW